MDVLRVFVSKPFKENFYGKEKNSINVLTVFYISYKNCVKTFLKFFINNCTKDIH